VVFYIYLVFSTFVFLWSATPEAFPPPRAAQAMISSNVRESINYHPMGK